MHGYVEQPHKLQPLSVPVVSRHNLEPFRDGHEVRVGGSLPRAPVQVLHLPQLPLQGQVALQDLRLPCAALQGPGPRVSIVSK